MRDYYLKYQKKGGGGEGTRETWMVTQKGLHQKWLCEERQQAPCGGLKRVPNKRQNLVFTP